MTRPMVTQVPKAAVLLHELERGARLKIAFKLFPLRAKHNFMITTTAVHWDCGLTVLSGLFIVDLMSYIKPQNLYRLVSRHPQGVLSRLQYHSYLF